MRKVAVAGAAALFLSLAAPAIALAEQASPPTTVDVAKTQVTQTSQVTRNTRDVSEIDTNGDDDSDKTGLWGLLGLLGLAGLAGLTGKRKNKDDGTTGRQYGATASGMGSTGVAPPKAEGATGTGRTD